MASFYSLPYELHRMIYKLVLCRAKVIGTWSPVEQEWPDSPIRLSAQLLRTCKEIHAGGLPILYGENTFEITISNMPGPYSGHFAFSELLEGVLGIQSSGPYSGHLAFPEALEGVLGIQSSGSDHQRDKQTVAAHLRRFSIRLRYTKEHRPADLRDKVRRLVWCLLKLSLPHIEF